MHAAIAFPPSKLHESSQTFNGLPVHSVAHKQQSHLLSPIFARANSFHALRSQLLRLLPPLLTRSLAYSSWLNENVLPLTRDQGKKRMGGRARKSAARLELLPDSHLREGYDLKLLQYMSQKNVHASGLCRGSKVLSI